MAIDLYSTRTMLKAVEIMKKPKSFLKDTFFSNIVTFDTEKVDVDIIKGKRRMAPFVSPRRSGKVVERLGYRTETYKAPMINPKIPTTAEHLQKRLAGEALYSGITPDQRAAVQIGRDLAELDDMITRREEWMCAQALFEGSVHVKGEGVDEVINFNHTNREVLSGTDLWSDSSSDPLADLKKWRLQVIVTSGITPDVCVMSSEVASAFIRNANVQKLLDLRLVETGQIDPQALPNGVTYLGYIKEVALNIYTYDEWYLDDETGEEKPMVPEGTVMLASTRGRYELLYGAYIDMEMGTMDLPRIPRSWTEKDPSTRWVQIISRPLPVPHEIDSIFIAKVL